MAAECIPVADLAADLRNLNLPNLRQAQRGFYIANCNAKDTAFVGALATLEELQELPEWNIIRCMPEEDIGQFASAVGSYVVGQEAVVLVRAMVNEHESMVGWMLFSNSK